MNPDDEFEQWLSLLQEDEAFDVEVDHLDTGAIKELRRIHVEYGPIFGDSLRERLLALRFTHSQRALRLVLSDLPATAHWDIIPAVSLDASFCVQGPGVVVHGREVFGIGFLDALVEIAANVQADCIDEFHRVWPLCPRHRLGLKPAERNGTGVWLCGSGPHDVARIGEIKDTRL
ncbi:hypothetical protein AB0M95_39425 [Sphaerisporangium sp. NPDC051017]|uniref:hypothetical protein n=1 Tax=Sphaerisporangium sp. NPDC051017 TaxID=3154636 RepID=UPI003418A6BF